MNRSSPRTGVYVCQCGTNIAATVEVQQVAEFARDLPGVVAARSYSYMCSEPGQALIKQDIQDHGLNRVVVASCSPLMHEPTFRRACAEAGLNPFCMQMANIREHCAWVIDDRQQATAKAKHLVAAAVDLESREPPAGPGKREQQPEPRVAGRGAEFDHVLRADRLGEQAQQPPVLLGHAEVPVVAIDVLDHRENAALVR